MWFDLDRLPTDPVLLQKILREMAEAMELEQAELKAAKQTVKAQNLSKRRRNPALTVAVNLLRSSA
jgi:transposase